MEELSSPRVCVWSDKHGPAGNVSGRDVQEARRPGPEVAVLPASGLPILGDWRSPEGGSRFFLIPQSRV